jgi:hypothetical protein
VKKSYAKIKAREPSRQNDFYQRLDFETTVEEPASLELHPDRQAMLDDPIPPPKPYVRGRTESQGRSEIHDPGKAHHAERNNDRIQPHETGPRSQQPARQSYSRESQLADKAKLDAEAREKAREVREKDRRAMLKARRPDKDGRYKLGRQSKVLLNRVRRLVEKG